MPAQHRCASTMLTLNTTPVDDVIHIIEAFPANIEGFAAGGPANLIEVG